MRRMAIAAATCTRAMRVAKIQTTAQPATRRTGTTLGVMAPAAHTAGLVTHRSARKATLSPRVPKAKSSTKRAISK